MIFIGTSEVQNLNMEDSQIANRNYSEIGIYCI